MTQDKIWAYFQNAGVSSFDQALPRYKFLKKEVQKNALPYARVLNIGIGSGKLEELLMEAKFKVAALDPDKSSVMILINKGVNAQVGVIESLPFEENSFDIVIASEVLEHLESEKCDRAITEIHRVLNLDGYFIGTVPYEEVLDDNLTFCPHCSELFHRWGHQQTFNKEVLTSYFEDEFELVKLSRRTFVNWEIRPKRLIKSSIRWVLGRMGEQIASPHFYFKFKKVN